MARLALAAAVAVPVVALTGQSAAAAPREMAAAPREVAVASPEVAAAARQVVAASRTMAFSPRGVAAAADPGLGVTQAGVQVGPFLIDPTAAGAPTDVRLSTNGIALGDLVIGNPDATPEAARSLDLELANLRIND